MSLASRGTTFLTHSERNGVVVPGHLVVGFATGTTKATNKTFEDDWVFAITVRDGRLTSIREYIDTQALARASQTDMPRLA
jgi:ketosteroid isomerase-like protein